VNILLINHYAGAPQYGMELRPYYLAREWCRQGHHVSIVAASQSHARTRAPRVDRSLVEEWIDQIRYIWIRTPRYHGNGLARAMNMFAFVARLELGKGRVVGHNPPDVVIASSTYPLDNVPAHRIAAKARARSIYEVHDLWPLSPMELGNMSRGHPFIQLMQWAENYACRRSDQVVSLLPKAEEHLQQHGMPAGKFAYIPNGIDVEEWQREKEPIPAEHRAVLTSIQQTASFLIGYAGAHGVANALHTVVEAAKLLRDKPVCFVLVGKGPEKAVLEERARQSELKNIVFLPPVLKQCIPSLFTYMDALYLGLQRQAIFRFGVSPNKLMDYMMAGKPVIQSIEAGNDLVTESQCGISVAPEDPRALAEAALRMMNWTPSERDQAGMRGRNYVLQHHDYRVLASRFLEVMGSVKQTTLNQSNRKPFDSAIGR
jgi:glycosyltransferase involved in cell wall biosynthesis